MNIGFGELLFILAAVLMLFGAEKIPELARSIGRAISEFKDAAGKTAGGEDKIKKSRTGRYRKSKNAKNPYANIKN